jgi:hypothetical protein
MSKELPYFKFFVSEWILGRVFDQPDKVQGAFIIAICYYWNKNCEYNSIDFEKKLGKKRFKMLLDLNFIYIENEMVSIPFLNEQFTELSDIHLKRVKGGEARAKQMLEESTKQNNSYLNKDKSLDKEKKIFLWRENFEVYLNECKEIHRSLIHDTEFINTQERLNPGVDIKLSLEKAVINFWATEAGWKHKKSKRSKEIDWKSTLTTAITMNKVYKPRDSGLFSQNQPLKAGSKVDGTNGPAYLNDGN